MVILLIGPSGVGKSAAGQQASRVLANCEFSDLDRLIAKRAGMNGAREVFDKKGADEFFRLSCQEVDRLVAENEGEDRLHLIAVGGGSLATPEAVNWLKPYGTILLWAPAEEVYQREPLRRERSLQVYRQIEYGGHRPEIYDAATCRLDVGRLSEAEAAQKLLAKLRQISRSPLPQSDR